MEQTSRPAKPPAQRRLLSDEPQDFRSLIDAARRYVGGLSPDNESWLHRRPFDLAGGLKDDGEFYRLFGQVLGLVRVLDLPGGSRVLEVGSGPGWVTELLVGLGLEVDSVEPCADLVAIARQRVEGFKRAHALEPGPAVRWHEVTIEECELPDASFDAVLFESSLHHVVDEHRAMAQTWRLLAPGGRLGITEGAWRPGNEVLERTLRDVMARTGTLENPFTVEYLAWLLEQAGFEDYRRWVAVDGIVPLDDLAGALDAARCRAPDSNVVTALRPCGPGFRGPTTRDPRATPGVGIEVLGQRFFPAVPSSGARLELTVRLSNHGPVAWLANAPVRGGTSVALRHGAPGAPDFREAVNRLPLEALLLPHQRLEFTVRFELPPDAPDGPWHLDLVSEWVYWFSTQGSASPVVLPSCRAAAAGRA